MYRILIFFILFSLSYSLCAEHTYVIADEAAEEDSWPSFTWGQWPIFLEKCKAILQKASDETVGKYAAPHRIKIYSTKEKLPKLHAEFSKFRVSAGVMGFVENEDELAFLLVRELAWSDFFPVADHTMLTKFSNKVESGPLRGEIKVDIKSVKYLIDNGYNPSAALNYLDRLYASFKSRQHNYGDYFYFGTVEDISVRRTALKNYILHQGISEQDLSESVKHFRPLNEGLLFSLAQGTIENSWLHRFGEALAFTKVPGGIFVVSLVVVAASRIAFTWAAPHVSSAYSTVKSSGFGTVSTRLLSYSASAIGRLASSSWAYITSFTWVQEAPAVANRARHAAGAVARSVGSSAANVAVEQLPKAKELGKNVLVAGTAATGFGIAAIVGIEAYDLWQSPSPNILVRLTELEEMNQAYLARQICTNRNDLSQYPRSLLECEHAEPVVDLVEIRNIWRELLDHEEEGLAKKHSTRVLNLLLSIKEQGLVKLTPKYLYAFSDFANSSYYMGTSDESEKLITLHGFTEEPSPERFGVMATVANSNKEGKFAHVFRKELQDYLKSSGDFNIRYAAYCWLGVLSLEQLEAQYVRFLAADLYAELDSLTAIADFLAQDWIMKGNSSIYSRKRLDVVSQVIQAHPEVLQSMDDINHLLSSQSLWARIDGAADPSTNTDIEDTYNIKDFYKYAFGNDRDSGVSIRQLENVHGLILERMTQLGIYPQGSDASFEFFTRLVTSGSTTHSDDLFRKMYEAAVPGEKNEFVRYAITNNRIQDLNFKAELLNYQNEIYGILPLVRHEPAGTELRQERISEAVARARQILGSGPVFANFIEQFSQAILSSPEESAYIESQKNVNSPDAGRKDPLAFFRTLSSEIATNWTQDMQWSFLQFLVGHTDFIKPAVINRFLGYEMSPLRIRRLFEQTPLSYQHALVDAMLSHPKGLLHVVTPGSGWTKTITTHLLSKSHDDAQVISEELLEAYLFALGDLGLEHFRSNVLAQLLVDTGHERDSATVLKRVCESFGATGVKVGQFIYAMDLLPDAEQHALAQLQDRSRMPTRQEVYEHLAASFGEEMPYTLLEVLGAGSLKIVVKVKTQNGEIKVLKILRKDALIHTKTEGEQLLAMVDYLISKYDGKYFALKPAIIAAVAAVKRELSLEREVANSQIAREHMYQACGGEVAVNLLDEKLVSDTIIEAEFSDGMSILAVADQEKYAQAVLQCETSNIFESEKIYLEPDRHFGNVLVGDDAITPIDFGQLLVLDRSTLELAKHVAMLASALSKGPVFSWSIDRLVDAFGAVDTLLKPENRFSLNGKLRYAFPDESLSPMAAYYTLLAAMHEARIEFPHELYDIPRALVQLKAYERFMPDEKLSAMTTPLSAFGRAAEEMYDEESLYTTWNEKIWQMTQ